MTHFAGTTFGLGSPANYSMPLSPWGTSAFAGQGIGTLQQVAQLLQIVPQQLQHLQFLQQQQSQQLQLLLHILPAQLQQLQQLIQVVPQQIQHWQQPFQPFGSSTGQLGFGFTPQIFGGPSTGHVM